MHVSYVYGYLLYHNSMKIPPKLTLQWQKNPIPSKGHDDYHKRHTDFKVAVMPEMRRLKGSLILGI